MSDICASLHKKLGALSKYPFTFDEGPLPHNWIYVLFDGGETVHGTDRIVRIGTHTGDGQMPSRLKQHCLDENNGCSIFRKNIGRALLSGEGNILVQQWEIDLTSRKARERYAHTIDYAAQQQIEQRVTRYIQGAFTFTVLPIEEKERRLCLESALISTISLCEECGPSGTWLGLFSPKQKIRESGLWQVNELYKKPLTPCEWRDLEGTADT